MRSNTPGFRVQGLGFRVEVEHAWPSERDRERRGGMGDIKRERVRAHTQVFKRGVGAGGGWQQMEGGREREDERGEGVLPKRRKDSLWSTRNEKVSLSVYTEKLERIQGRTR